VASLVLIGIPFLLLFLALWFLLSVWFTVKSVLGILNLLANRTA
jgi:ABC-type protease/lipase transport system fused ATPase/permease subunit